MTKPCQKNSMTYSHSKSSKHNLFIKSPFAQIYFIYFIHDILFHKPGFQILLRQIKKSAECRKTKILKVTILQQAENNTHQRAEGPCFNFRHVFKKLYSRHVKRCHTNLIIPKIFKRITVLYSPRKLFTNLLLQ